jgi:hypothetical protein
LLIKPADGAALGSRDITFSWGAASICFPEHYDLQIQYRDMVTNNWKGYKTVTGIDRVGGGYTFANFSKSDHGRWRMRTTGTCGTSPYSGWREFTFAPGAVGSTTLEVVTPGATFHLPAGTNSFRTVSCPDGTLATGGGWFQLNLEDVRSNASVDNSNGWGVQFENADVVDHDVFVYGQCLRGVRGYSIREEADVVAPPGGIGAAVVTCSKGVRTGGGFLTDKNAQVFTSQPTADPAPFSWSVQAFNDSTGSTIYSAFALCAVGTGLDTLVLKSTPVAIPPSTDLGKPIECPAPRLPLSGGFRADSQDVLIESSSPILMSAGEAWMADGRNLGSITRHLQAYAVCGKLKP